MRETSNYKLSQWDKTDRIKMEDFNSDNQKIDSQLHAAMQQLAQAASQEGLAAEQAAREAADAAQAETLRNEITAAQKWVKIGEATLDTAAKTLAVTVSNAEQYHHLEMDFYASGCYILYPCWNENTGPFRYAYYSSDTPAVLAGGHVNFYPICGHGLLADWAGGGITAAGSKSTNDSPVISADLPFSGTVTVGISDTSTRGKLAAGSTVIVYGMKK